MVDEEDSREKRPSFGPQEKQKSTWHEYIGSYIKISNSGIPDCVGKLISIEDGAYAKLLPYVAGRGKESQLVIVEDGLPLTAPLVERPIIPAERKYIEEESQAINEKRREEQRSHNEPLIEIVSR